MGTKRFKIPVEWADSRSTLVAVASAIHAIASNRRDAQLIWESPTPAEWDRVRWPLRTKSKLACCPLKMIAYP